MGRYQKSWTAVGYLLQIMVHFHYGTVIACESCFATGARPVQFNSVVGRSFEESSLLESQNGHESVGTDMGVPMRVPYLRNEQSVQAPLESI